MGRVIGFAVAALAVTLTWVLLLSQGGFLKASLVTAGAVTGGPFAMAGAVLDWDWFFADARARPLVEKLGRVGARVFYFLLGGLLTAFGVWALASGFYL